jgi:hypothetical protein
MCGGTRNAEMLVRTVRRRSCRSVTRGNGNVYSTAIDALRQYVTPSICYHYTAADAMKRAESPRQRFFLYSHGRGVAGSIPAAPVPGRLPCRVSARLAS